MTYQELLSSLSPLSIRDLGEDDTNQQRNSSVPPPPDWHTDIDDGWDNERSRPLSFFLSQRAFPFLGNRSRKGGAPRSPLFEYPPNSFFSAA